VVEARVDNDDCWAAALVLRPDRSTSLGPDGYNTWTRFTVFWAAEVTWEMCVRPKHTSEVRRQIPPSQDGQPKCLLIVALTADHEGHQGSPGSLGDGSA
jgi:hypothetical protein